MWTIFKVFIESVTILLLFYVLVFWPQGMWDLSFLTRDWTHNPYTGRWSLNHWTTREVPSGNSFIWMTMSVQFWTSCDSGTGMSGRDVDGAGGRGWGVLRRETSVLRDGLAYLDLCPHNNVGWDHEVGWNCQGSVQQKLTRHCEATTLQKTFSKKWPTKTG